MGPGMRVEKILDIEALLKYHHIYSTYQHIFPGLIFRYPKLKVVALMFKVVALMFLSRKVVLKSALRTLTRDIEQGWGVICALVKA